MCQFIESIKLLDGQFYRLPFHQVRVDGVFEHFFPSKKAFDLVKILTAENFPQIGLFKCRIVFNQSIQLIEFVPYTSRKIRSLQLIETQIEPTNFKSVKREDINMAFAQKGICDDVLMLNNGFLSDASYYNIALWNGEKWCTPRIPVIYGTQRSSLLNLGKIVEKEIRKEDISFYKTIRLFNAMVEFGEIELDVSEISLADTNHSLHPKLN